MADERKTGQENVSEGLNLNNLADAVTGINKGLNLQNLATSLNQGTANTGTNNAATGQDNTSTGKKE